MGWEVRHDGRRYLYRNRRVNGKPVKEYLAADDRCGFGELMAHDLARLQKRQARVRALQRQARVTFRERIDGSLAATGSANAELRTVAEGILYALGFHKHHRGEWRMKFELKHLRKAIDELQARAAPPGPMLTYTAPADDAQAVEGFAQARAGDADAQAKVRALIVSRKWVGWVGDLARQATYKLISLATAGDPVWVAGLEEKVNALWRDLAGVNPSVLESLLVRRVVNG